MEIVIGIICCLVFGFAMVQYLEVIKLKEHVHSLDKIILWKNEEITNLTNQLIHLKHNIWNNQ